MEENKDPVKDTANKTKNLAKKAKNATKKIAKGIKKLVNFIKRHPKAALIMLIVLLAIASIIFFTLVIYIILGEMNDGSEQEIEELSFSAISLNSEYFRRRD